MDRPRHQRTSFFVQNALFDGLKSFSELENRISRLETPLDRGHAFEVLAEAYLATQAIAQAKQVWPFDSIPLSVRKSLALDTGRKDMGVDGVYETSLGRFNGYQVKFRNGRVPLVWDELSTFMGLADNVAERVLFTNSNDLPVLMNQRHDFFCIRGSDLDRLEERDFKTIQAWLRCCLVREEKKKPRPHQQNALTDILRELEQHNRVTAIMAFHAVSFNHS